jgi:hypothetical protein
VNFETLDHFTSIPQRRSRPSLKTQLTPTPPHAITAPSPTPSSLVRISQEERRQAVSPVLRQDTIRSFHLPFIPPSSPEYVTASSGDHRSQKSDKSSDFDTVSSVSFAEMKTKIDNSSREIEEVLRSFVPSPAGTTRSARSKSIHNSDRISITQLAFGLRTQTLSDGSDAQSQSGGTPSLSGISKIYFALFHAALTMDNFLPAPGSVQTFRNPSELPTMVRSLIIFQL